jgi:hypothetical protein
VEEFQARGFTDAKALEGGVEGWKASVERSTSSTG